MAYDDIRISELPSLPEIHNNDLFLIQDVTNNLAHKLDWGRLKNNIGRLSKGIIFPLGTEQEQRLPSVITPLVSWQRTMAPLSSSRTERRDLR